ncbi:hypothetical protein H9P43_001814 [Blastocladiella emersonii ATCC 22665]|nr:hypothetical protein H9P43_001814 [Blastocladiella emersonii ATCC 22665]
MGRTITANNKTVQRTVRPATSSKQAPAAAQVKQQQTQTSKQAPATKQQQLAKPQSPPTKLATAKLATAKPASLTSKTHQHHNKATSPTSTLNINARPFYPKQQSAAAGVQQRFPQGTVYRATPVREHPDDAFLSGAWMFDEARVPSWMAAQLPKQQVKQAPTKAATTAAAATRPQQASGQKRPQSPTRGNGRS